MKINVINKNMISGLSKYEILILINLIAIFLPFFVCAVTIPISMVILLINSDIRKKLLQVPYIKTVFAFMAVTLLTEIYFKNIFGIGVSLLIFIYAVFSICTLALMNERLRGKIIDLSCALSVIAAIVALIQLIFGIMPRAYSTFFNPNYYAYICELMIIICAYCLIILKNKKPFYIISIGMNFAGLFASGCRSAWPAALVGMITLLICLRKYLIIGITAAATGAVSVSISYFPNIIPRFYDYNREHIQRVMIWKAALKGFFDYPIFGRGNMTFYAISKYPIHEWHSHNIALEFLISFGIVGTVLICIFFVSSIISAAKHLKSAPISAVLIAMIAATLIHGITDVTVMGIQTGCFFMLLCALTGIQNKQEKSNKKIKPPEEEKETVQM